MAARTHLSVWCGMPLGPSAAAAAKSRSGVAARRLALASSELGLMAKSAA